MPEFLTGVSKALEQKKNTTASQANSETSGFLNTSKTWRQDIPSYNNYNVCPYCGRCRHCGQGGPYYPSPYVTWTWDGSGNPVSTGQTPVVHTSISAY